MGRGARCAALEVCQRRRWREFAEAELVRMGVLSRGDVFGLVAGTTNSSGATNFMRLITVGENSPRSKKKNGKPKSRR